MPCLVDANGIQPTVVKGIPPQLVALMRTNLNVQELTVAALMEENREHVYHAAMLDPHTAAELDLRQIRALVDDLIAAHGDWLPALASPAQGCVTLFRISSVPKYPRRRLPPLRKTEGKT